MEEEIIEDPIWRRVLIVIGGIILIILVLSYFLASYPLFPIIESLSESKIAENKTIVLEDFSIVFTEDSFEKLQEFYRKDLSVEMAVCLKGKIENDYIIDEIYQPEILEKSVSHVSFKPCSTDTIILLHSQPFRHCIASQQDIMTLEEVKKRNPYSIMVIMCEPNRFSIYK